MAPKSMFGELTGNQLTFECPSSVSLEYKSISHQELVSCNQNVFINPQELILRPIAASEKSEVVAANRTPGLLI